MTKTYNRFHDPYETDPEIERLRELHAAMDRAVLDAYAGTDIPTDCEFLLDYEIDESTWGRKKKPVPLPLAGPHPRRSARPASSPSTPNAPPRKPAPAPPPTRPAGNLRPAPHAHDTGKPLHPIPASWLRNPNPSGPPPMIDLIIHGADPSASARTSPEPSVASGKPSAKLLHYGSKRDSRHVVEAHSVSHYRGRLKRPSKEDNRHG